MWEMLTRRPIECATPYHGIQGQSSVYLIDITCNGEQKWLDTLEVDAHAYDAMAQRYGRNQSELNFPEAKIKEVEFRAPSMRTVSHGKEKAN